MHVKLSIYITLHLYAFFWKVYCDEADIPDDNTPSTEELENIYSFFYSKNDNFGTEKQVKKNNQSPLSIVSTEIQSLDCKNLDERNIQEAMFYKRLISILLSNLAIQRYDDRLIGTLNIEASSSQFEYLQNFVKGQGSIREVDRILDNIIQQPNFSTEQFMAETSYYLSLLKDNLMHYLQLVKEHWEVTIISFVIIANSFMILRRQRWSRGLIVFLMFETIFIISFFITWWQLIQEAEIKLMAAQAQFAEKPIACQPHKMGLWDKMVSFVYSTNDCEKYYQTIMTNPKLQVTPALALTHFLSTVIFHPLSCFGTVISEFIKNATSDLNVFYKFPVVIILFLSVCICIVLVPLFLLGGSINFGIGPFFKFMIKGKSKEQEHIERIYEDILPKELKTPEKIKQITFKEDKDLAGGDAGIDTQLRLKCKHKKSKCDSEDLITECEREEKIDDYQ